VVLGKGAEGPFRVNSAGNAEQVKGDEGEGIVGVEGRKEVEEGIVLWRLG